MARLKEKAMNRFRSQYYSESTPDNWRKTAEIVDSIGGAFARVPYAEAFVAQYLQVFDYNPVSESSLYSSGRSYAQMFQHIYRFPLHE